MAVELDRSLSVPLARDVKIDEHGIRAGPAVAVFEI